VFQKCNGASWGWGKKKIIICEISWVPERWGQVIEKIALGNGDVIFKKAKLLEDVLGKTVEDKTEWHPKNMSGLGKDESNIGANRKTFH